MKGSLGELVGGYRKRSHSSYSFSAFIIDESICFEEEYDYYPRDDDEGMLYVYGLSIPLSHLDAFLSLLLKRCGSEPFIPQINKSGLLSQCLKQLVSQGEFKDFSTVAIKENLMTVHRWLEEEGIPHKPPYLAF